MIDVYRTLHLDKPIASLFGLITTSALLLPSGGIAGLATAAFLADDAMMPGENITILEKSTVVGGSMEQWISLQQNPFIGYAGQNRT